MFSLHPHKFIWISQPYKNVKNGDFSQVCLIFFSWFSNRRKQIRKDHASRLSWIHYYYFVAPSFKRELFWGKILCFFFVIFSLGRMGTVLDSHFLALTAIVTVSSLSCCLSFLGKITCSVVFSHIWFGVLLMCSCLNSLCHGFSGGLSVYILPNHRSFQNRSSHWFCRSSFLTVLYIREVSCSLNICLLMSQDLVFILIMYVQEAQTLLYLLFWLLFLKPLGTSAR